MVLNFQKTYIDRSSSECGGQMCLYRQKRILIIPLSCFFLIIILDRFYDECKQLIEINQSQLFAMNCKQIDCFQNLQL